MLGNNRSIFITVNVFCEFNFHVFITWLSIFVKNYMELSTSIFYSVSIIKYKLFAIVIYYIKICILSDFTRCVPTIFHRIVSIAHRSMICFGTTIARPTRNATICFCWRRFSKHRRRYFALITAKVFSFCTFVHSFGNSFKFCRMPCWSIITCYITNKISRSIFIYIHSFVAFSIFSNILDFIIINYASIFFKIRSLNSFGCIRDFYSLFIYIERICSKRCYRIIYYETYIG